jgi:CheY-like chemotaxis protein
MLRRVIACETQVAQGAPVFPLSAHAMTGDRELCWAAGIDAYASKPIRAGELFEVIAR